VPDAAALASSPPWWAGPSQQLSTHAAPRLLSPPTGAVGDTGRAEARRVLGQDKGGFVGDGKRKNQKAKQRQPLTTSQRQTNAQPVTGLEASPPFLLLLPLPLILLSNMTLHGREVNSYKIQKLLQEV